MHDLSLAIERILQGERWISSPLVDKLVKIEPARDTGPTLSTRQRDILDLLQQGCANQEIARKLGLSVKTIENHLTRLYRTLGVSSPLEAIAHTLKQPEHSGVAGITAAQHCDGPVATTPHINLLLVDDNARYRSRLRHMVAKAYPQATIYEAAVTQKAVQLAKRVTLHLALIDVVLGDESGIQCTRALHATTPTTRIVLISAYPDQEFHRSGVAAGACAFLDKKVLDIPALQQIINDIVAS